MTKNSYFEAPHAILTAIPKKKKKKPDHLRFVEKLRVRKRLNRETDEIRLVFRKR